MRRLLLYVALAGAVCAPAHAQTPVWVTPDVPTTETLSGNQMLPWEIWKYDGLGYTPAFSVPGNPDLHAIHKMDVAGDWLFSVEAASDLGGLLMPAGSFAEPRDVIWFDSTTGTFQLCLSGAVAGIPPGSAVDAIHVDGGDTGDLILSFDVPTDVPPFPVSFEPADLVRFGATGIGVCTGHAIVAANPDFDASAAPPGVPISSNAAGADGIPNNRRIFAYDIPTDIAPFAGPTAFVPGQIARWNAAAGVWQLYLTLTGWPISSVVDGLSCGGTSPGRVTPYTMKVNKATVPPTDLVLTWPGSCAAGATDYGIYEGQLGNWYSHSAIDCNDAPPLLTEQITPLPGSRYYLVVPLNGCQAVEGSYGRCSTGWCGIGDERPIGTAVCAAPRIVPTPPACP